MIKKGKSYQILFSFVVGLLTTSNAFSNGASASGADQKMTKDEMIQAPLAAEAGIPAKQAPEVKPDSALAGTENRAVASEKAENPAQSERNEELKVDKFAGKLVSEGK